MADSSPSQNQDALPSWASDDRIALLRDRYRKCSTPDERRALADESGLNHPQFYLLASRLGLIRPSAQ